MTQRSISRRSALGTVAAAGLAALFPAAGPARAAAPLPNGSYTVSRLDGRLLTLDQAEGPVVIRPSAVDGGQEWEVQTLANGNATIRNVREGTYLGFAGVRQAHQLVVGNAVPVEWNLRETADAHHIVVPDTALALERSPLRIYPPRTGLGALRPDDPAQAWQFTAVS